MHRLKKIFIYGLLSSCLFTSCKLSRPDDVIDSEKMESIIYDYQIAKSLADQLNSNENYKKELYIQSVYQKNGVTKAEFDSSMVWYTRHADDLVEIYNNVEKKLSDKQDEVNLLIAKRTHKPVKTKKGDSIDIWYKQRLHILNYHKLENKVSFSVPVDPNFEPQDTIKWNLRFLFAAKDTLPQATMGLSIVYSNDSVIAKSKEIITTGEYHLTLQSDTLGKISAVNGFVYYKGKSKGETGLILDKISLVRYHQQAKKGDKKKKKESNTPLASEVEPQTAKKVESLDSVKPAEQKVRRTRKRSSSLRKVKSRKVTSK